jgi:ATP-dependent helicase/nuclease subunit B
VQLLDDQAARYGDFDDTAIVGLIDNDWPERAHRNIFYSPALLKPLGWPSDRDRRAAVTAQFIDLLCSSAARVTVSTVSLDEDTLVEPSPLLDEVCVASLEHANVPPEFNRLEEVECTDRLAGPMGPLAAMRRGRPAALDPAFHGVVGGADGRLTGRTWSVSALEVYLTCPFKFFAEQVLHLQIEPNDEEVMDARSEGLFVHRVFESFFQRWQQEGHRAITPENLARARQLFEEIAEQELGDARMSETEAALVRTRLLGSPAAAGLADAVLRMEADRRAPVVGRLLEHALSGEFVFETREGPRTFSLRAKADRIDLLADGTLRLIDYKLGWPPNKTRALQLPIYALCAEQKLQGHLGRRWTAGEAVYLAFKGPKRVVPVFADAVDRATVLQAAQERLAGAVDGIERGDFPPRPDDAYRCETCRYAAVCRKDFVGDA